MAEDDESIQFDPEFPTGEWIGFYQDFGGNHRQEMHLWFGAGRISGNGADDVGAFTVAGGYDTASLEAWWTKTYVGSHSVFYKGFREVKGIWGMWEIPPGGRDGFHIWPRVYGDDQAANTSQHDQQPTTAPHVPVHSR